MNNVWRKIGIISVFAMVSIAMFAYTERNLLVNKADKQVLKECLITDRSWIPYPVYTDRSGWDDFFGKSKMPYIKEGEKYLDYQ